MNETVRRLFQELDVMEMCFPPSPFKDTVNRILSDLKKEVIPCFYSEIIAEGKTTRYYDAGLALKTVHELVEADIPYEWYRNGILQNKIIKVAKGK